MNELSLVATEDLIQELAKRHEAMLFCALRAPNKKISAQMIEAEKEVDVEIAAARKRVQMEAEDLSKKIIAKVLLRSLNP